MQVFEYARHPDCLFRARLGTAPRPLPVPGGQIPAGATVLELHLWNEHVPPLPAHGPDLAWATRSIRLMRSSLEELASCLDSDPRLVPVEAVGGVTALFSRQDDRGAERVFRRLGFAVTNPPTPAAWRAFWDDVHAWMLMWAFNQASVRGRRWGRMRRAQFWATREQFLARHGGTTLPRPPAVCR